MKKILGITLVEMLIALSISILILNVALYVILNTDKKFQMQMFQTAAHGNAREAIYALHSELKSAGYIGCGKLSAGFLVKPFESYAITSQNKVSYQNNKLIVRHASAAHANLLHDMTNNAELYVSPEIHFAQDEILAISDCESVDIFKVQTVEKFTGLQKLTTTIPLEKKYLSSAEISHFEENTFYIDKINRLIKMDIHHKKWILAEGIKKLQAEFTFRDSQGVLESEVLVDSAYLAGVALSFMLADGEVWYDYAALREASDE